MDKPRFRRHDSHKRIKLSPSWRKPRGRQSKARLHKRGYKPGPSKGYGRKRAEFGTVKGLLPVVVATPARLDALDPKRHAVVIASAVGGKRREAILQAAKAKGLRLLTDAERQVAAIKARLDARRKERAARVATKKEKKALEEKVKKEEAAKEAAKSDEEKQAEEKRERDRVLTQRQV